VHAVEPHWVLASLHRPQRVHLPLHRRPAPSSPRAALSQICVESTRVECHVHHVSTPTPPQATRHNPTPTPLRMHTSQRASSLQPGEKIDAKPTTASHSMARWGVRQLVPTSSCPPQRSWRVQTRGRGRVRPTCTYVATTLQCVHPTDTRTHARTHTWHMNSPVDTCSTSSTQGSGSGSSSCCCWASAPTRDCCCDTCADVGGR